MIRTLDSRLKRVSLNVTKIEGLVMGMDSMVVLTSFINEMDAQLLVMELQAAGLEAQLQKDDCGGMRPLMNAERGVEVLVSETDVERAAELLGARSNEMQARTQRPSRKRRSISKIDVIAMLVVGMVIGTVTTKNMFRAKYFPEQSEVDRNGDGSIDQVWFYDQQGVCTGGHEDNNFDSKWDTWHESIEGDVQRTKIDSDFNGIVDAEIISRFGVTTAVNWHPNETAILTRQDVYKHGILSHSFIDTDKDGTFDVEERFGPFGSLSATISLK